jgi:hypothetical protein
MDVTRERVRQLVESYGYTLEDFDEYASGKTLPALTIHDECVRLLGRLDETKLRAVHALLVGFVT